MPGGSSGVYINWNQWLYASYAEFCRSCNVGIISRSRFEPLFMDICKHQLKLNVYGKRNTKGLRIINVAVRETNAKYEGYPSIVQVAADPKNYVDFYGAVQIKASNEMMEDMTESE
jgi:hypothetical protein